MGIFERLHQLKILLRVVVHRRNELGSGLGDGLDLRRDDVAEILQPHVALALHAKAADAVARHLRQERAGHALDAERKAGVLDRAGVADVVQPLQKRLGLFGRQAVQQRLNVRIGVAELCRCSDGFFRVICMGNELYQHIIPPLFSAAHSLPSSF